MNIKTKKRNGRKVKRILAVVVLTAILAALIIYRVEFLFTVGIIALAAVCGILSILGFAFLGIKASDKVQIGTMIMVALIVLVGGIWRGVNHLVFMAKIHKVEQIFLDPKLRDGYTVESYRPWAPNGGELHFKNNSVAKLIALRNEICREHGYVPVGEWGIKKSPDIAYVSKSYEFAPETYWFKTSSN
jgi:heme/copper-type cytochrome/quinol oxidase subunit 4